MERVEDDKFLGKILAPGNEMTREINEMIALTWKKF